MAFLIADEQFTKAIEPRVCDFDDPAPGALALGALGALLAARANVRRIVLGEHLVEGRDADEPGVGAQVLGGARCHPRARDHDRVEGRGELADVMPIGAGHDE